MASSKSSSFSFNPHGRYFYSSKTVSATPITTPHIDSRVLLVMSELDLQQLATDLGQRETTTSASIQVQIPLAFRNDLQEAGWKFGRSLLHQVVMAADGTLWPIETVTIPVEYDKGSIRLTVCVSSQLGCPLCSFCATSKRGYLRNLQRHELSRSSFIEGAICKSAKQMSTISTVESWHLPNTNPPCLSETIVPGANGWPLDALVKDCKDHFDETSRKVSFVYMLLAGVNNAVGHAVELAGLIRAWGSGYHAKKLKSYTF
ncbi:hypothetical protein C5167_002776 [Papaver somniferum]|uniref:Uncharacterized protein n=1 Tax=Papaver somniferum TaxID=3469 RepID=A0A4Y7KSG8_PAPSO|nr:hypothetical protein C5167_002776 [Papaver somniferum]